MIRGLKPLDDKHSKGISYLICSRKPNVILLNSQNTWKYLENIHNGTVSFASNVSDKEQREFEIFFSIKNYYSSAMQRNGGYNISFYKRILTSFTGICHLFICAQLKISV